MVQRVDIRDLAIFDQMLDALSVPTSLRQYQSRVLDRRVHGCSFQFLLLDNCLLHLCLSVHADRFRMGQDDPRWPLHRFQYALRLYRCNQHRYRRCHSVASRPNDMVLTIIQIPKACHYWGIFSRWLVSIALSDAISSLRGPANVRLASVSPASSASRPCSSLILVTQLVSFRKQVPRIKRFLRNFSRHRLRCCHVV